MVARTAGNDLHGIGTFENSGGSRPESGLQQLAAGDALFQRLGDGLRLLVDFLQHVVGELALFGSGCAQGAVAGFAMGLVALDVENANAVVADLGYIAFLQEHEAARDGEQGRDVGGDEILVFTDADDDRAAHAGEDDAIRIGLIDHGECIRAFKLGHRGAHGLEHIAQLFLVIVDAMRNHLGVRFRREDVTRLLQLFTQHNEIHDDAVVDDRNAVVGDMRMRIAF
ncbi:unannotated protein [freshwater metagenome]|uniref:Unannotated protein n=1 Tax=freshwater metagenome TaxID=449393 RepID=A0A6J7RHV4_9ZZZZ